MKIIFALNNFLPTQIAGTEVYTFNLAKQLQICGYEVLIVIPNYGKAITETYEYDSITVTKFAEPSIVNRAIIMGNKIALGVEYFVETVKKYNPNIVHFNTVSGSNGITLQHVIAINKLGIKSVLTMHLANYTCATSNLLYKNYEPCNGKIIPLKCTKCVFAAKSKSTLKNKFLYFIASTCYKLGINTVHINTKISTAFGYPFIIKKLHSNLLTITNNVNVVVVLTSWYKNVLLLNNVPHNKLQLITQGLPINNIVNKNYIADTKILKLVFVGRLTYNKGLHILLNALLQLNSTYVSLAIYGPIQEVKYAHICKNLSLKIPNITWHGIIEANSMVQTLKQYDCLVLPSIICEMSPLVIQEAFAAGIPIIASNVYGNAEQITHGKNGWLFNFNDVISLQNTLQQLFKNSLLVTQAKSNLPLVKPFSTVVSEYITLYKNLYKS